MLAEQRKAAKNFPLPAPRAFCGNFERLRRFAFLLAQPREHAASAPQGSGKAEAQVKGGAK